MINAECWNIEPDLINYHEREWLGAMRDDLPELNFSKKYNPTFGLHTSDMGYRYEHERVDGDGPFLF